MWSDNNTMIAANLPCRRTCLSVFLLAVSLSRVGSAQDITAEVSKQASGISFHIASRRPLYTALRKLGEQYGWTIDFEQTLPMAAELDDVASPAWKSSHVGQMGVPVPKQRDFVFTIPTDHVFSEGNDKAWVVQAAVSAASSILPDRYVKIARSSDGRIAVVELHPSETKSVGDYTVSLGSGAMDGATALTQVLQKCSQSSGQAVQVGAIPVNLLSQTQVAFAPGEVTCRQALSAVLDQSKYKLAYSLIGDPGSGSYVFNVEPARVAVTNLNGETVMRPVLR
jgi:hypothetical protein